MASTLQLEFAQAMSDFKTMFPDMERDVIEAVLRANQGAVDATIDQLLAMSTDNQVHNNYLEYVFCEILNFEYHAFKINLHFRMKNYDMNWSKMHQIPHHRSIQL